MILFYLYSLKLKDFKQHGLFHILSLLYKDAVEKYAKAMEEPAFKFIGTYFIVYGLADPRIGWVL